jgi:hypothetical protein
MRFSRLRQLSTDAVQHNRGTPMGAAGAAEDLGPDMRLVIPVSFSIVTNTTALVLPDWDNTDDRQRPVDRHRWADRWR